MQSGAMPQIDPKQLRKTLLTWGILAAVVIAGSQIGWGNIWREALIRPMLNALLLFYAYLGRNFVVAITVLTIVLRLITWPLTAQASRSSRRVAEMQPKLAALQKKYGNDKARVAQEQQKLYKEAGISPLGGCLPTLVQFPIWIALVQAINAMLADTPIELMSLGMSVYRNLGVIPSIIPIQNRFLWLNLALPDPSPVVLPILVGGTMWLQQRLMTPPSTDAQTASMNQTMQIMMPLMFGYFTTQFSSGMAIYFIISNIIGIGMQFAIDRIIKPADLKLPETVTAPPATREVIHERKKQRRKAKR